MQAVLPENAIVKTWSAGDQPVSALKPGDRVIGYCTRERALKTLEIGAVEPVAAQTVLQLHIQHFRWINVYPETMANTAKGAARADSGDHFVGYCVINPLRSSNRTVIDLAEASPLPGVVLHWEGSDLLWSEGLLVGSS